MVKKICQKCHNEFEIENWRLKDPRRGKFCSMKCTSSFHSGKNHSLFGKKRIDMTGENSKWWKGGKPNCIICGKKLSTYVAKRCQQCNLHYHSGENHYLWGKKRLYMSREKHPNWKGGTQSKNRLDRIRFRNVLQKKVFERDDYTCQLCGTKNDLQVDHIQSWAEYVELRFNINNCRTLCSHCHYKITFGKPMPDFVKGWGHNLLKGGALL